MKQKSEFAVKVGAEIRRIRNEQKRSQEGFADDCQVHRTYMGSIERGEQVMSIDMTKRIVGGLGLSLSQFFAGIDE